MPSLKDRVAEPYSPSDDEEEKLKDVGEQWTDSLQQKTRPYRHLNDRSIEQFWRMGRDRFDSFVPEPDRVEEEWLDRSFKPKTRNKTIATAATIVASGVGLEFRAVDDKEEVDRQMSVVVDDGYEWALEREEFDLKFVMAINEMAVSGTAHLFVEIAWDKRMVKEITDMDFATGDIKFEKKERVEFKGVRTEVVPNEEIYPGNVWESDIQKQPYLFRRKISTFEAADPLFSKYSNWKSVRPGRTHFFPTTDVDNAEIEDDDPDDNNVEIVYYWNKMDDEFHIVVNNVLLTKVDNPIPYPHKQYPFAKSILQPFSDIRFYWGNSVPNMNIFEQDIINNLWRMYVDSVKLKNKPPLLVSNSELANTDLIIPGTVTTVDSDDAVRTIPEITRGVASDEIGILQQAERQMDENSLDPLVSGQQAQGDPTATEVRAVVGSSERIRGFQLTFVGSLLMQHARLYIPNLLWFLTHDDEYKQIVRENIQTKGGRGKRKIEFVSGGDLPTSEELLKGELEAEKLDDLTELISVNKDSVQDYRFHVSISPVPKQKRSGQTRLLKAIQKFNLYANNPVIDQIANTEMLVEALGDSPDQLIQKPPEPAAPELPPPPGLQGPEGSAPTPQTVPGQAGSEAAIAQQAGQAEQLGL